jgi:hypothetical protein
MSTKMYSRGADPSRRSRLLRQAIERNLHHYQRVERAMFAHIYQQGMR